MLHCCQPAEFPLAAFQTPVVPVARARVDAVPRLVVRELRVQVDPARGAALAGRRRRVPVGVRQRRPVVTAGRAGLHEQVVPLRLGVVRRPERHRPARRRHRDLTGEPLVGDVRDLRVDVLRAGVRVERTAGLVVPRRGPALELLELVGRQDAAGREERRPPEGVAREDGIVEAPREAGERVGDAQRVERCASGVTVVGHGDVAAQVVLQHVLGWVTTAERTPQRQAAPRVDTCGRRVAGDLALGVVQLVAHGGLVYCWPAESPAKSTLPPSFMYERNCSISSRASRSALPPARPAMRVTRSLPVSQMTAS